MTINKISFSVVVMIISIACNNPQSNGKINQGSGIELVVLGVAQDAGAPHIACIKECCVNFRKKGINHPVVSLAIIDHSTNAYWLIEATPDISYQLQYVNDKLQVIDWVNPEGIFISHAHIGHYTGLMYLGREAMNSKEVKVHCMPRMNVFLRNNGPWNQLVKLNNITIDSLENLKEKELSELIKVTPFKVPHRDEYSEAVGFKIELNGKKVLFIPDIDKWKDWSLNINEEIKKADLAFLDATFFNENDVPGRNMSEIPHPFVQESVRLFQNLNNEDKKKVIFIHFNHTNPLLNSQSNEFRDLEKMGFQVAQFGDQFWF